MRGCPMHKEWAACPSVSAYRNVVGHPPRGEGAERPSCLGTATEPDATLRKSDVQGIRSQRAIAARHHAAAARRAAQVAADRQRKAGTHADEALTVRGRDVLTASASVYQSTRHIHTRAAEVFEWLALLSPSDTWMTTPS